MSSTLGSGTCGGTSRKRRHFEDLSCVAECSDAIIQGVVTVGPMNTAREGRNYFTGSITDGKRKLRVYGFDASIRRKLSASREKGVVLKQCEVKRQKLDHGDGLEV